MALLGSLARRAELDPVGRREQPRRQSAARRRRGDRGARRRALWRDETVKPRVALDVSQVDATVTGGGWPLRPVGVKLAVRPPGGGQVQAAGRVGDDPSAPTCACTRETPSSRITSRTCRRRAIQRPRRSRSRRGRAGAVRAAGHRARRRRVVAGRRARRPSYGDQSRSSLHVGARRRMAPERQARELALRRPWILLERDQLGTLPLPALLTAEKAAAARTPDAAQTSKAAT